MDPADGKDRGSRRRLAAPAVDRVARRLRRVFAGLEALPYLGAAEREDFHRYLEVLEGALGRMDAKVAAGRLRPLDLRGFPQVLRYPGYTARVGVFIGSFDPFQMTHLAMALDFLASDRSEADLVIVVPEGSPNPAKPRKSDYAFRYELLRLQVEGLLEPFVVPLDLGAGADTLGIVEGLIDLHPGARLELTHLLGSDSLPMALRYLDADLEAWRRRAALRKVDLVHGLHVALRTPGEDLDEGRVAVEARGSRFAVEPWRSDSPSSTDFRAARHLAIVVPTEAVLARMELLFRYGIGQAWMLDAPNAASGGLDFQI